MNSRTLTKTLLVFLQFFIFGCATTTPSHNNKNVNHLLTNKTQKSTPNSDQKLQDKIKPATISQHDKSSEIKRLENTVRPIPALNIKENLRIYRELSKLDPGNKKYTEKVDHYSKKLQEEYAETHDFRGIYLGITISEFRKITPITADSILKRKSKTICTGDNNTAGKELSFYLRPVAGTEESGGVVCKWAYNKREKYFSRYELSGPSIAGYAGFPHIYRFNFIKKPGDNEPRLYQMVFGVNPKTSYPLVMQGLLEKYGTPTFSKTGYVQNMMGAIFSNKTTKWESKKSILTLQERSIDVETGTIDYVLKEYIDYVNMLTRENAKQSIKM